MNNEIFCVNLKRWVDPQKKVTDNFRYYELACRSSGVCFINMEFMEYMIQPLREQLAIPLIVNSACRSVEHNANVGGHPRSLHLMFNRHHQYKRGALAVDISTVNWDERVKEEALKLAKHYKLAVGLSDRFMHLDGRTIINLPRRIFTY